MGRRGPVGNQSVGVGQWEVTHYPESDVVAEMVRRLDL